MDGETPGNGASRILVLDRHEAICPAGWQDRGGVVDAMCVISERLVEPRQLADRAIDEVRLVRGITRVDIGVPDIRRAAGGFGNCANAA